MKLLQSYKLHEGLKKNLCDDFIYSLVTDGDGYLLAVSCHKSEKYKFNHNKNLQLCAFTKEDLNKDINDLVNIITNMYKNVMLEKTEEDLKKNENLKQMIEEISGEPSNATQ